MKLQSSAILSVVILAATTENVSKAFTTPLPRASTLGARNGGQTFRVYAQHTPEEQVKVDDEIARLKAMAQKLRAEAAAMEAERAEELAQAAENAFRRFDKDGDGEITFEELKVGLEKVLKTELPENRVKKLLEDFDTSGDGVLQLDEFVGVEKFRNKLEALARDEKKLALEAKKAAQLEAEISKLVEAQISLLNDKEPSTSDKIISVLPYLFPLLDSLQFGRFLLVENQDNPFVLILALLYGLYQSIPFSGLVAFFALSLLSSNLSLNRLIRFNMQQAIYLDIALFFPGLLAALYGLVASGAGFKIPPAVTEIGSDVIFGALLLAVGYAAISSLLGITPNKIPIISQAVEDRMPTIDMFDSEGRYLPREMREKKDDDENDKKK